MLIDLATLPETASEYFRVLEIRVPGLRVGLEGPGSGPALVP
jgi:hypothetical protein